MAILTSSAKLDLVVVIFFPMVSLSCYFPQVSFAFILDGSPAQPLGHAFKKRVVHRYDTHFCLE